MRLLMLGGLRASMSACNKVVWSEACSCNGSTCIVGCLADAQVVVDDAFIAMVLHVRPAERRGFPF